MAANTSTERRTPSMLEGDPDTSLYPTYGEWYDAIPQYIMDTIDDMDAVSWFVAFWSITSEPDTMNQTHSDPCCCKTGCECRMERGQCKVCAEKIKRDESNQQGATK